MSVIKGMWTGKIEAMILPSGLPVKLKKITMMNGGIVDESLEKSFEEVDLETKAIRVAAVEMILNETVRFCLVEPAVADKPDGEHLTLGEISRLDKIAIFQFAIKESEPKDLPITKDKTNRYRLNPCGEAFRKWQSN